MNTALLRVYIAFTSASVIKGEISGLWGLFSSDQFTNNLPVL
jgi:hypothetical protein